MGAQNIEAGFGGLSADDRRHQTLAADGRVDFVSRLELFFVTQRHEADFFQPFNRLRDKHPLGLRRAQAEHVFLGERESGVQIIFGRDLP